MANLLYNTNIRLFGLAAKVAANFNSKAKLFVQGRKSVWDNLKGFNKHNVVWFHAASLGEFEQGKPVMEKLKAENPEINLMVSFFSPSGYEERKDWPLATTCYLPIDTPENAKRFIDLINPKLAVFIRYEFWANYLDELNSRSIPTTVMAAQFRPDQFLFKSLGSYLRSRVARLDAIMVQYQSAKDLLIKFKFDEGKISVCGDSRFDRVLETVEMLEKVEKIERFKGDSPLLILGSCYEKEVDFVKAAITKYPNWKFLFAPHHVDEDHIQQLIKSIPAPCERFTRFRNNESRILVLDTIGKLAASYRYADLAIVGGGFRDGIHNILEPAAFGAPIFFGPTHKTFPEAQAMIDLGLAYEIDDKGVTENILFELMSNETERNELSKKLQEFVQAHAGAKDCIVKTLSPYIPKN